MNVILLRDKNPSRFGRSVETCVVIEDDGSEDGGKTLAECRGVEIARMLCAGAGWVVTDSEFPIGK